MPRVYDILLRYFDSQPEVSAAEAAKQISDAFEAQFSGDDGNSSGEDGSGPSVEGALWSSDDNLWYTLLALAVGKELRAVELLKNLEQQDHEGSVMSSKLIWDQPFRWSDLPLFGPTVREIYNGPPRILKAPTYATSKASGQSCTPATYLSINILLSHFMVIDVNHLQNWAHYFIWAVRDALEEPPEWSDLEVDHEPVPSTSNTSRHQDLYNRRPADPSFDALFESDRLPCSTDLKLISALPWIRNAARTVYSVASANDSPLASPKMGRIALQGSLAESDGHHWEGFDERRWSYWQERSAMLEKEAPEHKRLVSAALAREAVNLLGDVLRIQT